MTTKKTTAAPVSRPVCKFPGCEQPAAPAEGTGRPPEYCAGRGHTRASAWKERRRLAAEKNGTTISAADDASPVTMAKVGGAELLRSLRAEADRISALGKDLRERIDVLTDPTAAEAEVEAVRAAAEQRAATAESKAADAERRAAQADQFRVEADDAAEQMSEELTVAQDRASAAEERAQAAEADRDAAVAKAQADTEERIAAVVAEWDATVAKASADAEARVLAAEADRDEARKGTGEAKAAAAEARQDIARAEAAAQAAQAETERVRADAARMLGDARTDAAREREELRADLRSRAERAERQADAYRDELAQLRAVTLDPVAVEAPAKAARRGTRAQSAQARSATDQ
jgi:chromosome segregation ATPase